MPSGKCCVTPHLASINLPGKQIREKLLAVTPLVTRKTSEMSDSDAGVPSSDLPWVIVVAPPPTTMKLCRICGKDIPASAIKCTECDSPLYGLNCVVCGAPMPTKATRCSQCDGFQDWRRRIPGDQVTLALLVSILSITGLLAPQVLHFINLRSRTSGFFLDVDQVKADRRHFITVRLTNEGGRSAQVEMAHIDFRRTHGISRVKGTDLDIANRSAMIVPATATVDLKLYTDDLTFVGEPSGPAEANDAYNKDVAKELCSTDVLLTINVRERDRFNRLGKPNSVTMAMTRDAAESWVLERATGKIPEDTSCP
jgi:predicted nucleic acid-binding Zn ribbon protein